jgi:hypothetical protein
VIRDIVIRMTMEKMVNMLETYQVNVKTIANRDKTLIGKINLTERAATRVTGGIKSSKLPKDDAELNEIVDRKLDKVYERVRNDNWIIWKESIRLTEKEFSEGGIKKTMDFLPKVTYDRKDLKKTINSLMYDDAEQLPKPVIKIGQSKPSENQASRKPNPQPSKKPDSRLSEKTPKSKPSEKKPSRQSDRRDSDEESKR